MQSTSLLFLSVVKWLAMVCRPTVRNYVSTCTATLTQWGSRASTDLTHLGGEAGMAAGTVVVVAKG